MTRIACVAAVALLGVLLADPALAQLKTEVVTAGAELMAALSQAPAKEHRIFTGGGPPQSTRPCLARMPHGFLRIEGAVVETVAGWIGKR